MSCKYPRSTHGWGVRDLASTPREIVDFAICDFSDDRDADAAHTVAQSYRRERINRRPYNGYDVVRAHIAPTGIEVCQ